MSIDSSTSLPFAQITKFDHSPWVIVISAIFIIYSFLALILRVISKFKVSSIGFHDGFMFTALALAFAQTVCIIHACKWGLGRHYNTLSELEVEKFSKSYYAAQILLILSLTFTKVSNALFNMSISPQPEFVMASRGLLGVIVAWGIAGTLALSFQCSLPKPWRVDSPKCVDQFSLQVGLGVVNILTDLALVILPIVMVLNIQTTVERRMAVITLYSLRLSVPVFAIIALSKLKKVYETDVFDPSWNTVLATIWYQVMMNMSIITLCVLGLKRILDSMRIGLGQTAIGAAAAYTQYGNSYGKSVYATGGLSQNSNFLDSSNSRVRGTSHLRPDKAWIEHSVSGKRISEERSESVKGLTDGVIVQTVGYSVDVHDADHRLSSSMGDEDMIGRHDSK